MAGKMRLTDSMRDALDLMAREYGTSSVPFRTGEALLKRGLAERYTLYVSKAVYVTKDSVTPQGWPPDKMHEWFITLAGRALSSSGKTGE